MTSIKDSNKQQEDVLSNTITSGFFNNADDKTHLDSRYELKIKSNSQSRNNKFKTGKFQQQTNNTLMSDHVLKLNIRERNKQIPLYSKFTPPNYNTTAQSTIRNYTQSRQNISEIRNIKTKKIFNQVKKLRQQTKDASNSIIKLAHLEEDSNISKSQIRIKSRESNKREVVLSQRFTGDFTKKDEFDESADEKINLTLDDYYQLKEINKSFFNFESKKEKEPPDMLRRPRTQNKTVKNAVQASDFQTVSNSQEQIPRTSSDTKIVASNGLNLNIDSKGFIDESSYIFESNHENIVRYENLMKRQNWFAKGYALATTEKLF
ncbi:UNKNOWN [Stylonychia lemnae]|uniref:Uncharacterized protein n=1 Tax=Stylonychia lemnae TaxID=5949 RepID=A0A078AQH3_STYLE|nr:UNKNOWN [Stylonychia lemnae]|eukprot:CDW83502.1 UNKNOWN [Stylonychia lemnae]